MHQGSAGLGGTAADVEIYASQLDRLGNLMSALTAEHTGRDVADIIRDGQRDRWFSATEALEYGMIDHVAEHIDDVRPGATKHKMGM
jgi:ATP-dependent Clp protease protease subunit